MTDGTVIGALAIGVLAEVAVVVGLVMSVVRPSARLWPPGEISWKFWFYWGNATVAAAALAVVGYHTAGTFVFRGPLWDWLGALLVVVGLAVAGWAGYTFRMAESFGLDGDLHIDGPYRYTRNPQYVGMYAVLTGVLLLVNSGVLLLGTLPAFLWMALLPFAEEPWLRDRFGEAYERYRRRVPRFLGKRTVERALE